MGAGASTIDKPLTLDDAKVLAGDKWEDHLASFWPEDEETITIEKLLEAARDVGEAHDGPDHLAVADGGVAVARGVEACLVEPPEHVGDVREHVVAP